MDTSSMDVGEGATQHSAAQFGSEMEWSSETASSALHPSVVTSVRTQERAGVTISQHGTEEQLLTLGDALGALSDEQSQTGGHEESDGEEFKIDENGSDGHESSEGELSDDELSGDELSEDEEWDDEELQERDFARSIDLVKMETRYTRWPVDTMFFCHYDKKTKFQPGEPVEYTVRALDKELQDDPRQELQPVKEDKSKGNNAKQWYLSDVYKEKADALHRDDGGKWLRVFALVTDLISPPKFVVGSRLSEGRLVATNPSAHDAGCTFFYDTFWEVSDLAKNKKQRKEAIWDRVSPEVARTSLEASERIWSMSKEHPS